MSKIRNYTLDFVKCISAFLIVFIHATFSGAAGEYIAQVAQSGVLLFFMIFGYFCYKSVDNNFDIYIYIYQKRIKHSVKHIFSLIIFAYIINIIRILALNFSDALQIFKDLFSLKHFIVYFALNVSGISGVMWFMLALLYTYIIFGILLQKFKTEKPFYILSLITLLGNFILGDLLRFVGITQFSGFIRNFLFTGIPFFGIGNFIHKQYDENKFLSKIKIKQILCLIFISLAIVIFEKTYPVGNPTYNFGNMVLSVSLFLFALKKPNINIKPINWLGENCCFFIYILHPVVIHILKGLLPDNFSQNLFAILVLITTVMISIIICRLSKFTKLKKS